MLGVVMDYYIFYYYYIYYIITKVEISRTQRIPLDTSVLPIVKLKNDLPGYLMDQFW